MITSNVLFRATLMAGLTAATLLVSASLKAAEIKLPVETARYVESSLPGYQVASTLCMTCHSADYPRTQPPSLNRAFWKANVVKMQKTFGAPIPDEQIDPLVDYLVKTYGNERAAGTDAKSDPKR